MPSSCHSTNSSQPCGPYGADLEYLFRLGVLGEADSSVDSPTTEKLEKPSEHTRTDCDETITEIALCLRAICPKLKFSQRRNRAGRGCGLRLCHTALKRRSQRRGAELAEKKTLRSLRQSPPIPATHRRPDTTTKRGSIRSFLRMQANTRTKIGRPTETCTMTRTRAGWLTHPRIVE